MATVSENCQLCHKEKFKYTCPRCNIAYCSLACYKSQAHLKCSEDFYKTCIQEELTSTLPRSRDDMRRIYEILERIRQSDAGEPQDFKDALDSDDDEDEEATNNLDGEEEDEEEEEEENIALRLQGIDINDADQVWQRLTPAERQEFQQMIESGAIMKLLPDCRPWWCDAEATKRKKDSKIVELPAQAPTQSQDARKTSDKNGQMPSIATDIRKFSEICQRTPSPCLHYNLWNILAAYACTVRFFGGESLNTSSPGEAAAHLVNLSATLKYGTNFEDAEDAIISVEMEAQTTGNGAGTGVAKTSDGSSGDSTKPAESRAQLQQDARQLMCARQRKLAALSDVLQLFQLARRQQAKTGTKAANEQAQFQKLFAVCSGSVELNRKRLLELTRKIEFLLSYVNREAAGDGDLK